MQEVDLVSIKIFEDHLRAPRHLPWFTVELDPDRAHALEVLLNILCFEDQEPGDQFLVLIVPE